MEHGLDLQLIMTMYIKLMEKVLIHYFQLLQILTPQHYDVF